MFTRKFWKDAFERVVGTAAAVAIPTFTGTNLWEIDYATAAGITGSAAVVTLLKCLAASRVGSSDSAGLVNQG